MSRERTAVLDHVSGETFEAVTGTGRRLVFGDDPERNELSPVETLATTLAACSAMDVVAILGKKRQRFEQYRVEVVADQRDEYPQIFTRVEVLHVLVGPVLLERAVRRAIELSATKYCPVSATLSAGDTIVHHRYRIRCTGQEAFEAEGEAAVTGPFRTTGPLAVVEAADQR
jgi:putative redox protein